MDSLMSDRETTIYDRIQGSFERLTQAERQLAGSILENYPASGLGSLATLAGRAGVSVPTVARMVQKLGFQSFPEFQSELRDELTAKAQNPIAKRDTWAEGAPSEHLLNRFTDAVIDNIRGTLGQIDPERFDAACALVADTHRHVYVVGGRISHMLAEYLFMHLQMIRPQTTHIQSTANSWPHYMLDVKDGDVFVIFDVRRYENNTLKLAELAREKGAKIILFTDQWRSPVQEVADITFGCRIVVPSAWDSLATIMLLIETMISVVKELNWDTIRTRMEDMEVMFDKTKLFRKFNLKR